MRIVRPSGVWNSRAPLHNFFQRSAQLQQVFGLLTCAVARTRYDADHIPAGTANTSARGFMRSQIAGPVASKAWMAYRDAWRRLRAKESEQPTIQDVERDLALTLFSIRESTVVSYSALFESFVQCWALNMLLAALEANAALPAKQVNLAERFSPVGKEYVVTPGVPTILDAFPDVKTSLATLPHISTDPKTGAPVEVPVMPQLNALRTMLFWRDYRNYIVHRDSVVSLGFCRAHAEFFELLRAPYAAKLSPLQPGRRLQLPDVIYYAITTVHNRAAVVLNSVLQDTSAGARGHIRARGDTEPEPSRFDGTLRPRPLLETGDHPDSLAWVGQFVAVPELDEDESEDA